MVLHKVMGLLAFVAVALFVTTAQAANIFTHDFESAGGYTTSDSNGALAEFNDGTADYFTRTDGSDISATFTGASGFFFAGQDIDATEGGATLPVFVDFTGIDISGYTSLGFSVDLAEDDDGANNDWDSVNDYLHVSYQIDDGGYQNLLWLENDGTQFNTVPLVDTDFDGIGDGTEVTDTFASFLADITGTGSTLDLRFELSLDAGDEDIAFDNVTVTGEQVPEPAGLALLGMGLVGLLAVRRRRK